MGKHSEWRKLVKKLRRKKIRQEIAKEKHDIAEKETLLRESSPSYQSWLEEQKTLEEFREKEEERLAKEAERKFIEREIEAQKQWKELQHKLELAKEERAKQIAKIKEEWDREQKKLQILKEEKEKRIIEEQNRIKRLQESIEEYVNGYGDLPQELNEMLETNPGKITCPFFKKTAACRFNDTCSRNHVRPTVSSVLVIRNFYVHYSLDQTMENEHGSDSILEFENHERYSHFKEFFYDVLTELQKFGNLRQFKVCCNQEVHLRGNVYVEYKTAREAIKCCRGLQGRWYGGKQLNVEFVLIESWKSAICGLFHLQRCPKGSVCNFLHVFRNPNNMFMSADRDLHRTPPKDSFESDNHNEWRWSESPERPLDDNYTSSKHQKNGNRTISHSKRKRSRSRDNYSSTSRNRKKSNSRSRHRSRSGSRSSRKHYQSNCESSADSKKKHEYDKSRSLHKARKIS